MISEVEPELQAFVSPFNSHSRLNLPPKYQIQQHGARGCYDLPIPFIRFNASGPASPIQSDCRRRETSTERNEIMCIPSQPYYHQYRDDVDISLLGITEKMWGFDTVPPIFSSHLVGRGCKESFCLTDVLTKDSQFLTYHFPFNGGG